MLAAKCLSWAAILAVSYAHGMITSPKPRVPGTAMAAACGQQVSVYWCMDHVDCFRGLFTDRGL